MPRKSSVLPGLAAILLLLLGNGCAHDIPSSGMPQEVWMTYAANVPHGVHQRVGIFVASETPAIVISGFPTQRVTISIHDESTGRLLLESDQYTHSGLMGIRLEKPMAPGRYVVRASQDGTLKCQATFSVH